MTETQNSVRLGEIIKEFHLELLHEGEDYQNIPLRTLDVNRPGLPLSGFFEHFDTKRLLVMGLTETTYVSGMSEERRRESFDRLLSYPVPALIYTRGIDPFPECMEMAQKYGRTVLRTQEQTSAFMSSLIGSLYNHLAPRITRSGVMMEIYGEGVLFQGESGVGKSEVAIELIKRGHRIIADDAVEIKETNHGTLVASAPELIRHYMELLGIGFARHRLDEAFTTLESNACYSLVTGDDEEGRRAVGALAKEAREAGERGFAGTVCVNRGGVPARVRVSGAFAEDGAAGGAVALASYVDVEDALASMGKEAYKPSNS